MGSGVMAIVDEVVKATGDEVAMGCGVMVKVDEVAKGSGVMATADEVDGFIWVGSLSFRPPSRVDRGV